jgi:hypothetical protein
MSDILDKLLGIEKDASGLTAEAEAEANRRKTLARIEAQKEHTRLLAEKARDIESRIAEERARLAEERELKNRAYAEGLRARPLSVEEFRRALLAFISSERA